MSRRQFLQRAGASVAVAAAIPSHAAAASTRLSRRRDTVAVFGGGVAGLTAAHELAERGFDVTIYERRAWGGKARSTEVPGTGTGGRRPLPSEHGFRFEFGFYQNLPDTMRRIPFGSNPNGAFDNMIEAPQLAALRIAKRDMYLPIGALDPRPYTPRQVIDIVAGLLIDREVPPPAAAHFADRFAVFAASCDARRADQWDRTSWADFVGSDEYGVDYRSFFGAMPEFAQATKSEDANTTYIASYLELVVYALLGRGANGAAFRLLDAPTNEAWIDPWTRELDRLGVRRRLAVELTAFAFAGGRIREASVRTPTGTESIVADWYVCALPVERARALWTPAMVTAEPQLANMHRLATGWMNGIQFYLRDRTAIVNGSAGCCDSPWTVSFVPQAQFWSADFASTYGDGRVHDKLSAVISKWDVPGPVFGKAARDCTPEEVVREVWETIKLHVNDGSRPPLTDDMVLGYDIDPGMLRVGGRLVSDDPLVLPTKGTAQYRPDVETKITNLLLCGDYLNGEWEVANMEAACCNGRRAANAVLARSGSRETPAAVLSPYRPPEWEPLRRIDEIRWRAGQPNLLDDHDVERNVPRTIANTA